MSDDEPRDDDTKEIGNSLLLVAVLFGVLVALAMLCGCAPGESHSLHPDNLHHDSSHSVLVLPPETEKQIANIERLTNGLHNEWLNDLQIASENHLRRLAALESKAHEHKEKPPCKKH